MFSSKSLTSHLNYQGTYPCPVCHTGKISSLPLMEAFACSFCQQIFTASLEEQQLKMPSRQPPLLWSWNGRNWKRAQLEGMELSWGYWLAAVALVVLPTAVIGLPAYSLHPNPDTPLFWVPIVWTGLTFLSHLGIVGWLMIEIFQFPLGAYFRAMQRYFLDQ